MRANLTTIKAVVKKGNRGTALLAACAANSEGPRALPRRKADKRKAVLTVFEQGLLKGAVDQVIADRLKVSKALVVKIRLEIREAHEAKLNAEIASRNEALKGPEAVAAPAVDVPATTAHAPRDLGAQFEDLTSDDSMDADGAPTPAVPSEPAAPKAPRERPKADLSDLPTPPPGPQWPAVRDAYEAILVELAAAVAQVEGVETRLLELADHGAFSRFDRSELERAFLVGGAGGTHKVRLALRAAARACPVQTCPTCDGDGCEACHHAGYIPAGEAGQAAVLARVGGR
jgi:hypothetical protein